MSRQRIEKPKARERESVTSDRQEKVSDRGAELAAEMDDILDEIDGVLEENAEEFVKSYIQKGGE